MNGLHTNKLEEVTVERTAITPTSDDAFELCRMAHEAGLSEVEVESVHNAWLSGFMAVQQALFPTPGADSPATAIAGVQNYMQVLTTIPSVKFDGQNRKALADALHLAEPKALEAGCYWLDLSALQRHGAIWKPTALTADFREDWVRANDPALPEHDRHAALDRFLKGYAERVSKATNPTQQRKHYSERLTDLAADTRLTRLAKAHVSNDSTIQVPATPCDASTGRQDEGEHGSDDTPRDGKSFLDAAPKLFELARMTSGIAAIVLDIIVSKGFYKEAGFGDGWSYAKAKLRVETKQNYAKIEKAGHAARKHLPSLYHSVEEMVATGNHHAREAIPVAPDVTSLSLLDAAVENTAPDERESLVKGVLNGQYTTRELAQRGNKTERKQQSHLPNPVDAERPGPEQNFTPLPHEEGPHRSESSLTENVIDTAGSLVRKAAGLLGERAACWATQAGLERKAQQVRDIATQLTAISTELTGIDNNTEPDGKDNQKRTITNEAHLEDPRTEEQQGWPQLAPRMGAA